MKVNIEWWIIKQSIKKLKFAFRWHFSKRYNILTILFLRPKSICYVKMNSKIHKGSSCPKCGKKIWMENIVKTIGTVRQIGRFCMSCAYFEPMNGENLCGIDGNDIDAIADYINLHLSGRQPFYTG